MSSQKTTPIDFETGKHFESGRHRLLRYSMVLVNAVTLLGSILLVTWVLGKIVAALHALVFSLALAESPGQLPDVFPVLEGAFIEMESQSFLSGSEAGPDATILTVVQQNGWH